MLSYPEGFPYTFSRPVVMMHEVRKLRIIPLAKADHPPVQVDALIKAWLTARVTEIRDGWGPGILDADIQLTAQATVRGDGTYHIAPQAALLKAWWRDIGP